MFHKNKKQTESLSSLGRLVTLVGLVLILSLTMGSAGLAQDDSAFVWQAGWIESEDLDLSHPVGLAFSPAGNVFHVVEARQSAPPAGTSSEVITFTPRNDHVQRIRLSTAVTDPINIAFDAKANRLLLYQSTSKQLIEIGSAPDGNLDPSKVVRHDARRFDLQSPQGMAVDPATGQLFILDASGPQIVRIKPDADGGFKNALITRVDLAKANLSGLRGLALNPTSAHLYSLSLTEQSLYELTLTGSIVASRDMSAFALSDPQGMVFAPSADQTDDASLMNLFIADSGLGDGQVEESTSPSTGRVVEVSFAQPESLDAGTFVVSLVQTIDTSAFSPPSPDSAGIAYLDRGSSDILLISDPDVDETTFYAGVNLFESDLSGTLIFTSTTTAFSDEPEGLDYNPDNGHLFVVDDDLDRVFEVDPGGDGLFGTSDDDFTSFSTSAFGSTKPLGVAYSSALDMLFIADMTNSEVYILTPGPGGEFNGVPPEGNDQWTSFDTASLGLEKPESVAFNSENGLLYLVGQQPRGVIVVTTTDGLLMHIIDISAADWGLPAGLTFGPSSEPPDETHIYIADRGRVLLNNEGKVFEMTLPAEDPTPPGTNLTSWPPNPDNNSTPTFMFTGSDSGGSGLEGFECQVDSSAWSTCTSPHTTPPLSDGLRTFRVRAVDGYGNRDATPASYTWRVDTTPPTTSLTDTPPNPDNDTTPTFSFSGSDSGGSGVDGYQCRVDSGSWYSCSSSHTTAPLNQGTHTFEVHAVDNAGNTDATPASFTWLLDTTPPSTFLVSAPPDPDDDSTPTFSFNGSDSGGSSLDGFQCRVDSGSWSPCTSPYTTSSLGEGSHTFEVRAVDGAGNADASPASHTWTIDTTPPDTSLTSTPPNPDNDNTPAFSFTGSDPGGSGVASYQCQVDGSGWAGCSSPYTTPGLSDGNHTFQVRAVDNANNTDPSPASYTWMIDTAVPDTTLTSTPPDPDSDNTPTFTFTSSNGPGNFECRVDAGSWYACTSPHTTAPLSDGSRTFQVRAVDDAGNRDPSPASYTWMVDTTPPDASEDSGASYTTDEETPFTTGNVLDNDSDPGGGPIDLIEYDDSTLAGTLIDNGNGTFDYDPDGQFEYLGAGEQGEDIFTYTIADAVDLTNSAQVIITVNGVNDAPAISDIPDQVTKAGVPVGPVAFTVDDIDTQADSLSLSFSTSNRALVDPLNGVTFDGSGTDRSLVVTPNTGVTGSAVVTITVSDGDLEASDTFLLMVEPRRIYLPWIAK